MFYSFAVFWRYLLAPLIDKSGKPLVRPFENLSRPVQQSLVWKNTRLLASPLAANQTKLGGLSYLISNRTVWDQTSDDPNGWLDDETYPLEDSNSNYTLAWYTSTLATNDSDASDYWVPTGPVTSQAAPQDLYNALKGQLNAQQSPRLTIFIHGVANLFSDAVTGTAALGLGLGQYGGYEGFVIGFDWPSFGELDSGIDYSTTPYAFPPTQTYDSIRGNINGSVTAFGQLMAFIADLRNDVNGLTTSLVCHSEGNYMAMLGLNGSVTKYFDHIILLAADINNGALLSPANLSSTSNEGQGAGLYNSSTDVTVYWTNTDGILSMSESVFSEYHNPNYQQRLGNAGLSGAQSDQSGNVYSVDCSNVLTATNVDNWVSNNVIPSQDDTDAEIHSSYLYVPQVLSDMAQVIIGTRQSSIPNRTSAGSSQWFTMVYETSTT